MNLEPETRNGYFISTEIKKVWAVEMVLLKKLLEVCEKYHLKIWAEGGTLLGAVRHHGYIPWDDDIDMAMPRKDYDKLQIIAKDEFKSPFFFQSGYTDLFPSGMIKLRMDGTSAIEKNRYQRKCHHGIFIDIFPLDVMPDDFLEMKTFINSTNKLHQNLIEYCDYSFAFPNNKYKIYSFINKIIVSIKGFHNTFAKYDHFVKQYNNNHYSFVSLISWFYDERYLRRREWYKETLFTSFEDITLPIPYAYHEILSKQYGNNYMIPTHSPAMHAGFEYLSTEISYKDILPKLMESIKLKY